MDFSKIMAVLLIAALFLTGCGTLPAEETKEETAEQTNAVSVVLSDAGITANGTAVSTEEKVGLYVANDIVYYEAGKDLTYGEGSEKDAHTPETAAAHTVLHIAKPGTYSLSGSLSQGQIAVDLGEGAENDPQAVVTLILNGVDITCEVAPAVIFYNVYECGSNDAEKATKDVDTTAAGANVIIADGTENKVTGSYVEKIYKPDSVVLNAEKTKVEDAKKLHKYDGAFYSKRSMNIGGGKENTGVLDIRAENEGLGSELHLTLNGGNIHISSGNDGINTNEDGVSVTTVNGGNLTINVTGETGEGDGIDSNGWLIINGGAVTAMACGSSGDSGIDSDMGIHINGGTVLATGNMLDRIESGGQIYAVFNFAKRQTAGETVTMKDKDEKSVFDMAAENAYSVLLYSAPELIPGTYTLWNGERQLAGRRGGMTGGFGGMFRPGENGENPWENRTPPEGAERPEGSERPEGGWWWENAERPEGSEHPEGGRWWENTERPEGAERPEGVGESPKGENNDRENPGWTGKLPENMQEGFSNWFHMSAEDLSTDFNIELVENTFSGITYKEN